MVDLPGPFNVKMFHFLTHISNSSDIIQHISHLSLWRYAEGALTFALLCALNFGDFARWMINFNEIDDAIPPKFCNNKTSKKFF